MGRRLPRIGHANRNNVSLLTSLACILVLTAAACQPTQPAIPNEPQLTAPPPATAPPAAAVTSSGSAAPSTVPILPTATPTAVQSDATLAPAPIALPSTKRPTPPPTPASTQRSLLPAATAPPPHDAAAGLTQMIEAIIRPRSVSVDRMWAFFITDRTLPGGPVVTEAAETQIKLLEMWHPGNVCYSRLEAEIDVLGQNNQFPPVAYRQYLNYINAELSPCLDEQLPLVDTRQFFSKPTPVRAERITKWLSASWVDDEDAPTVSGGNCGDIFDAHLPDAVAATNPEQLSAIWSEALNERFQCQFRSLREANELSELGDAHLYTLPAEDRNTLITLQITLIGHVLAIGQGKPYDQCWPDFEAGLPAVAAAANPEELTEARNASLDSLVQCVEKLPASNPFVAH